MSSPDHAELARTAATYEELLVPALFHQWPDLILDTANVRPGQRLLDVACGTGVLTRAAAHRVGDEGHVVGLDLNPAMLAVAAENAPHITWREGDALALPFDDASFDALTCQFGLMLFSEPAAALREMARVTAPGGSITIAVFDGLQTNDAYAAIASCYERAVDTRTAAALRAPFSLGNTNELLALFADAELAPATAYTHTRDATFRDARHATFSDAKGWFPFAGIHLDPDTIDRVTNEVAQATARWTTSSGSIRFPVSVHILTSQKA